MWRSGEPRRTRAGNISNCSQMLPAIRIIYLLLLILKQQPCRGQLSSSEISNSSNRNTCPPQSLSAPLCWLQIYVEERSLGAVLELQHECEVDFLWVIRRKRCVVMSQVSHDCSRSASFIKWNLLRTHFNMQLSISAANICRPCFIFP